MGYYNSFVVRIWSQPDGRLRGSIEHVASREHLAFLDPIAVVNFMRTHLKPPQVDGGEPGAQERAEPGEPDQ